MSNLTKEEVISALESALTKAQGKTVTIEQKGSWYKIDGGKSLRFSEIEAMLAEQGGTVAATTEKQPAEKKAPAAKKAPAKAAPKKAAAKPAAKSGSGMTPKELWRAKLAGKGQLPRGF
ncbi:hypothetical protein [Shewanella sp. Isolate11]|uniref:hypothetical protein n=1 Tax=Shewanella sp. Isolate11 TaxID=2908530 RepID=UPI001EFDF5A1|nr:hypothetical protein [Shewanella sp. Isolate11]MCG9697003.1 hypothetical protein [Shewanella sp. Isolate11]